MKLDPALCDHDWRVIERRPDAKVGEPSLLYRCRLCAKQHWAGIVMSLKPVPNGLLGRLFPRQ